MNLILFEENEAFLPLQKRDDRAIHLIKTLHKREGDEFSAGILGGKRGKGRIERIKQDGSVVFSLNLTETAPQRLPIDVAVGFPRPIQLRRLLCALSNMGVSSIALIGTELGDKNYRKTTLLADGGARAALIEGAAQGRDTSLPQLSVAGSVREWLDSAVLPRKPEGAALIACDNVDPQGRFGAPAAKPPATVAVGSERGWSDGERRLLEEAGFTRLALGDRALRTEIACIAAVGGLLCFQ
jgi:RsmE family RNA methyltransferase